MKPGEALFRPEGEVIYLALSLRNVGTGIAHLRGYRLEPETQDRVRADPLGPARHRRGDPAPDPDTFADQQRDLYVAPGDTGFWQAALATLGIWSSRIQSRRTEAADASRSMSSMAIWRMANQQLRDSSCFPDRTRPGAATLHTIGETSPEASSTWSGGRNDCSAAGRQAGSQFVPRAHCRRDLGRLTPIHRTGREQGAHCRLPRSLPTAGAVPRRADEAESRTCAQNILIEGRHYRRLVGGSEQLQSATEGERGSAYGAAWIGQGSSR